MTQPLNQISVQFIKGVGPARAKLFANLGVESIEDLFNFFPRRYEDRRNITPIAQLKVGEWQTVTGMVQSHGARRSWYTKKHVTEVSLDDGGGRLICTWFNQPYLQNYFKPGAKVVCYGKVDVYKNRLQMISPEYEVLTEDDESLSLQRIVPVYPLTRGMSQRYLRKVIRNALDKYASQSKDELPVLLRNQHKLFNIKHSLEAMHFPDEFEQQEEALRRICFEEFFFFQIAVLLRRLSITKKPGTAHRISDGQALEFINAFPFPLTLAQRNVIREIRADMQKPTPMLRLLQGDVGSGKTVVALFGCLMAVANKCQAAVMAPTEILARQHYDNVLDMMDKGWLKKTRVGLLVSSLKKTEREKLCVAAAAGEVDMLIGTHALINEEVQFKNLSFVVIDEQHKFGVRQRSLLSEKGRNPDVLIMTATPIPRTLCISLYGDLDVSVIDEYPPGRGDVKTKHFLSTETEKVYGFVRKKLEQKHQAYVVYPIVEESEKLDLKAAEDMFKQFQKTEFKNFKIGLVHGQMKKKDAQDVMADFKKHKIDLLVATTVLEVGVDVPNASVMVIEHAERFGLAQLHQLRGRIGRGQNNGWCLLVGDPQTAEGQARLDAIVSTRDGFKIAEKDLEIRGPGRFFGRHQHGLNELKVANPVTQLDVLKLARSEATALTQADPKLHNPENKYILDIIKQRYPTYLAMVKAG